MNAASAAAVRVPAAGWKVFLACFLVALPFVLCLSMTDGLSHDENQHIAAGALISREGLLPYRDFPHFHTPYLAFIHAALFRTTDHLLLAARLFSALCATIAVGLVGAAAAHAFRDHSSHVRRLGTAGAVILALSANVFTHTTGHAWNHEPPLLAALASFLVLASGISRAAAGRIFAGGILLGFAIGLRLTFAPLLAPFGLAVLLLGPGAVARRFVLSAWFSGGVLVALGGVAWLAALAPEQAWFANFEFAKVNVTYRFATGEPRTMTLPTKTRYLFKNIARIDLGVVVAFLVPVLGALQLRFARRRPLPLPLVMLLWCVPFLLMGALAPSPLFEQYFYPFVFFFILGGAWALASLPEASRWHRPATFLAGAGVLYSLARGASAYHQFPELLRPKDWTGFEIHDEALQLRSLPSGARVLTLEPIPVLEARRRIYPEFSTGPFAWRIAPFIDPAKAVRLKIPSPDTLLPLLAATPPDAVLLGAEEKGELLLKSYARMQGYHRLPPREGDELWVRP